MASERPHVGVARPFDRPLGDRIAEYLAGTGRPLTSREIARGIHSRHADVLRTLETDSRFYLWPSPNARKKPYGVRAEPMGGPGAFVVREHSGEAA